MSGAWSTEKAFKSVFFLLPPRSFVVDVGLSHVGTGKMAI
jgi:hypothetical protein